VAITCKAIIPDEEADHTFFRMCAKQQPGIIGGAVTGFAPLHVDDRAAVALEWTAAPASKEPIGGEYRCSRSDGR
jgi:hypothetical protein